MWAAITLFFKTNAMALFEKAAMLFGLLGIIAEIYRAGAKAEQNDQLEMDLGNAKEALKQDAVVGANSDVSGMRNRLSAALRRKHDA